LGEVWYAIAWAKSHAAADQYVLRIRGMAIDILDADWETTRQAALFKTPGNISFADCFAAELEIRLDAEVVTGDKEFAVLEGQIGIARL